MKPDSGRTIEGRTMKHFISIILPLIILSVLFESFCSA